MTTAIRRYPAINPLRPPFRGLTAIVWLYFLLCFWIHPASAIRDGQLIDPDDSMYLVQTLNLLDGQGWYDRIEHRLDPPAGVPIHFSRLTELPYAALIAPLRPFLGRVDSALVAAAIVPPLLLLCLMIALRWQAECFMPKQWAGLAVATTLLAQNVTFEFMPGRAGHHGLAPLLVALTVAFTSRLMLNPAARVWAVAAGMTLALAVALALETLPWLLLISALLGLWANARGCETRARAGLAFGAALALFGALLLLTYRAPEDLPAADLVSYSWVYVLLLAGIALCFAAIWRVGRWTNGWARTGAVAFVALACGGGFLAAFPRLLGGPYGAVDPALARFMLPSITEAIPLGKSLDMVPFALCFLPWPLLSFATCLWKMVHDIKRRRWLWANLALLQMAGFLLAAFYQARYADYAQMFGIAPLTTLVCGGLRGHATRPGQWPGQWTDPAIVVQRIVFLALAPMLSLGMSALVYGTDPIDLALFPMQAYAQPCDVRAAAAILNGLPRASGHPRLIMNAIGEGPDLLLRTPDSVLSAPYHTNVRGNLDAMNFFRTPDPRTAERIARMRGADFVLACRDIEGGYLVSDTDEDTDVSGPARIPYPPPFALQLTGRRIPSWLTPIEPERLGGTLLFRINPPE